MWRKSQSKPFFNEAFWTKAGSVFVLNEPRKLMLRARFVDHYEVSVNNTFYLMNLPTQQKRRVQTLVFDYQRGLLIVDKSAQSLLSHLTQKYDQLTYITSKAKCEYLKVGSYSIPLMMGLNAYAPEFGPKKQNANWFALQHMIDFCYDHKERTELIFEHDIRLVSPIPVGCYIKQQQRFNLVNSFEYQVRQHLAMLAGQEPTEYDHQIVLQSVQAMELPSYASLEGYQKFLARKRYAAMHQEMLADYPLSQALDDYFGVDPVDRDTLE